MAKKLLFIINSRAGKAQIKNRLVQILDLFTKYHYEVTVHVTQARMDGYECAKKMAEQYDIVVCSGGDGTMSEVVKGVMECKHQPLLGYIPAGTTNDFASSLHLFKDMNKSAKTVVDGVPYLCDIGHFNQDIFTYVAAFGVFTDVTYQTPQGEKNTLGHLAYILEGAKRLHTIRSYHVIVEHDGETIEDDLILGMITNSSSIGGFKGISGKNIQMDDGLFEVTLIKPLRNPLEFQAAVNALISKTPNPNLMYHFKTSKITFQCQEPIAWTLDGEFGGEQTEVTIQNQKHAITILRPVRKR